MIKTILKDWKDLQIQEVEMPKIGKEEALIRLIYGGICGTDVHVYNHNHKTAKVPVVLGHEYCGELVDFQTDFPTDLKVGDLVTSHPLNACKVCEPCLSGHENVCEHLEIYGVHTDGCFCEYIKVPIHKVYKFHKDIPTKVAALVEPLAVAVHDVRESGLRMSDSVFIIGGGPIGLLIALVARQCGASKVGISEVNANRIEFIRSFGIEAFNPMEESFMKQVEEFHGGKGCDVVFEVSGVRAGAELMTQVVKTRGMIVVVGVPKESYPVDTGAFVAKELKMHGVRIHPQIDFKGAVDLINSGCINKELERLVTDEFPLKDLQKAIDFCMEDQNHFKVLVKL